MKTTHIQRLLTRAGFIFPEISLGSYYYCDGIEENTSIVIGTTQDADMHIVTQHQGLRYQFIRFREDICGGGRSPCTWNALRCLAFATKLKEKPRKADLSDPKEQGERICKFLNGHHSFEPDLFSFPDRFERLHDDTDGEEVHGKIRMITSKDKICIRADKDAPDLVAVVSFNRPARGESPVIWNALMLLACAIQMDNSTNSRINIWRE